MNRYARLSFSLMMFVQFFIWGAWAVTLGSYLGLTLKFSGSQIGLIYGTTAIAAMISPLFIGLVADRFFSSQRVLGCLHLLGAAVLWLASTVESFESVYVLLLAYSVCYMPTLALANALCFRHMREPERHFPAVRVFGTIGWIVAGQIVGFMRLEQSATPLQLAAFASVALGCFAFFLPHTPPEKQTSKISLSQMLGFDAIKLLADRSLMVVFISSVLICIPLAFYYNFTNLFLNEIGLQNAAGKMTVGQMSEIFFMLLMPLMFRHLGIKWMLVVGMLAWVTRYILFAYGGITGSAVWMLYLGILLHGICYDFFFVAGQVYANNAAPEHLKNSVQSLMAFGTYGVGMFVGALVSGRVVDHYTYSGVKNWQDIWLIPAIMTLLVLIVFYFIFNDKRQVVSEQPG